MRADGKENYQELTSFQRDLLWLLADLDAETSGQDVKAAYMDFKGEEIGHGRLYPNLDVLTASGFVNKGQIDRRTNSYEISKKGFEALQERSRWESKKLQGGIFN